MNSYNLKELISIFQKVATKVVSFTDINKGAYVVNKAQRELLTYVGFQPGITPNTTDVPLIILGGNETVNASYYGSQRVGSGRTQECRMGLFLDKLEVGQKIAFATDGRDVFLCEVTDAEQEHSDVKIIYETDAIKTNENLSLGALIDRAKKVKPKRKHQKVTTTSYYRDPAIIAFAHRRSKYKCEMLKCKYVGFNKDSGGQFIEAHHIKPLSEGGEDSISNIAALCPTCHRKMHYSNERDELSKELKKIVVKSNKAIGIKDKA